jgi:hypothetical protein
MGFLSWLMGKTKKAKKTLPNGRYNELNRSSRYGYSKRNRTYYPNARPDLPSNWWNKHRANQESSRTANKSANKSAKKNGAAANE